MEHLDKEAQSLMLAVAFGGVIVFGAMRLFSSFSSPFGPSLKNKKKKQKQRKKKVKSIEGHEEPVLSEEPASKTKSIAAEVVTTVANTENVAQEKKSLPAQADIVIQTKNTEAPEVNNTPLETEMEAAKKKKRKKRQKNKAAVDEQDTRDAVLLTSVPAPFDVEVEPDLVETKTEVEEGWERVPVKLRGHKQLSAAPNTASNNKTGTKETRKELRKNIDIGEYKAVILGEGGSTVVNIESVSGAKIQIVSLTKDSVNHSCIITGDETEVAVASEMINSVLSNQAKAEIILTSRLDKAIISKAETMQKIRQLSGAKLEYQFGEARAKDEPFRVLITGETSKVEVAKELINDYLAGKTPDGNEGIKRVQVSNFQARLLIGKKGEKIGQLQKSSGASINIEFTESEPYAVVSVIGTEEQISRGVELIRDFLSEYNFTEELELHSDAKAVLQKFNDIRKEIPNLKLDVSEDRSRINFTGSQAGVNQGKSILKQLIEDELGPPKVKSDEVLVTIELGSAAGKVIGKNGATLKMLEENAGPDAKVVVKRGSICYVYGQPSAVKKLSSDIEAIVIRHNGLLSKTQKEEAELYQGVWRVVEDGTDKTLSASLNAKGELGVAMESDWGGFRLAQLQGW